MNEDKNVIVRKFLDGNITKNKLKSFLGDKLYTDEDSIAIVTLPQIRNYLDQYLKKKITFQELIDWVNFVWFSGYCDYEKENEERIAEILNLLEELDEIDFQQAHEIVTHIYKGLEK